MKDDPAFFQSPLCMTEDTREKRIGDNHKECCQRAKPIFISFCWTITIPFKISIRKAFPQLGDLIKLRSNYQNIYSVNQQINILFFCCASSVDLTMFGKITGKHTGCILTFERIAAAKNKGGGEGETHSRCKLESKDGFKSRH